MKLIVPLAALLAVPALAQQPTAAPASAPFRTIVERQCSTADGVVANIAVRSLPMTGIPGAYPWIPGPINNWYYKGRVVALTSSDVHIVPVSADGLVFDNELTIKRADGAELEPGVKELKVVMRCESVAVAPMPPSQRK